MRVVIAQPWPACAMIWKAAPIAAVAGSASSKTM